MKGLSLLPSRVMLPLSSFHVLKLPNGLVLFQETSSGKSFYAWACFLFSEEYPLLWKKNGAWEIMLRLRIVKLFYSFWKARQTSEMLVFFHFIIALNLSNFKSYNFSLFVFFCFVSFYFVLFFIFLWEQTKSSLLLMWSDKISNYISTKSSGSLETPHTC